MIPVSKGNFPGWLTKHEGMVVTIKNEFINPADVNPKLEGKGFVMGLVTYQGDDYNLSMSETAWRTIAKEYGGDTKDWIGKDIAYLGMKKMGMGTGHWWEAVK